MFQLALINVCAKTTNITEHLPTLSHMCSVAHAVTHMSSVAHAVGHMSSVAHAVAHITVPVRQPGHSIRVEVEVDV